MKPPLPLAGIMIASLWMGVSRVAAQTPSFTFVSWADSQGDSVGTVNTTDLSSISNQVQGVTPAFTMFPGDLCYGWSSTCASSGQSGWKYALNGGTANNGMFNITFPFRGNHDDSASGWDTYFSGHAQGAVTAIAASNYSYFSTDGPDRTYSFDYLNSHFVGIDMPGGGVSSITSGQISWLNTDITNAENRGVTHTFVFIHGPIYYVDGLPSTPPDSLITMMNNHPSISATFHGHEHLLAYVHIDSSRISKVTHPWEEFVSGGTGGTLASCDPSRSDYCTSSKGFVSVDVDGNTFTVNLWLKGGGPTPAKSWTFTKSTPLVTLSPSSLTFSTLVGTTSSAQTLTLTNGTATTVSISGVAITGSNSGDFAQTNNCGSSLAPGAACAVNVSFTPSAAGSRTASLAVTDNAAGSPQTASLSGTGITITASVSPSSLTFSSQNVGTTSAAQAVTLSNTGTAPLSITSFGLSGANSADFAQTNNCGASLAVGAHCTINVTFSPAAAGTRTATLSVTDNASNSPQTVGLTGTGAASSVTLLPSSVTFSNQLIGTTSAARSITLSNPLSTALSITSIAITGTNSGDFAQTNGCGTSLAANSNCLINVTFTPSASGTRTATLTVTDNATNSPQTTSLSGTGATSIAAAPSFVQVQNNLDTSGAAFTSLSVNISTSPGSLLVAFCRESSSGTDNFTLTDSAGQTWTQTAGGYQNISDTGPRSGMFYRANSAAVTSVTVHYSTTGGVTKPGIMVMEFSGAVTSGVADGAVNSGAATSLTTSTSGSLTTTNPNDILIFATNTSGDETGWTAGAGYTIPSNGLKTGASGSNVRMAMQYAGVTSTQSGASTSMTYAPANWNGNVFAAFKGAASSGGSPSASLSPASLIFSSQNVGTTSVAQAVTLSNSGSAALSISSISITGTNSGDFAQTNTCGPSLAAGANCTINVTFTPTAAGTRSGTLTVTDNATNSPQSASLAGTGATSATASLAPASLSFGSQNVGTTSTAQSVTLSNSGSIALSISSISIAGTNSGDFAQTNTCGTSLAAGANCTINVAFTPTASGTRTGTLTVTDDASNSPQTAGLSGSGAAPAVSLSATNLNFGKVKVGTMSAPKAVTLTNSGTGPLAITSISIGGTDAGGFTQTNNCGASLPVGASCSLSITFIPTASGWAAATVSIADDAPNSPQRVSLRGNGS